MICEHLCRALSHWLREGCQKLHEASPLARSFRRLLRADSAGDSDRRRDPASAGVPGRRVCHHRVPSPDSIAQHPLGCPGNGISWLRDDVTGACCEYPCNSFSGPGFTAFNSRAQCESRPECNGSPIGAVVPSGDGCNTCTCVSANRWECTVNNCTGATVGKRCGYWLGGCPAAQYCAFVPEDWCSDGDAPSVCLDRPMSCTDEVGVVCGCDGRQYENRCEASRAGFGIRTVGPCRNHSRCTSTADCASDEYCPPWGGGRYCVARPLGCVNEFDPVCGKNGVAYGNRCLAAQAGVDVRNSGPCKATCSAAEDCAPDEYCSACSNGECLPRPRGGMGCVTVQLVCGCDGRTFLCPESALALGTAVAHDGECP